jgi:hypothetical protein
LVPQTSATEEEMWRQDDLRQRLPARSSPTLTVDDDVVKQIAQVGEQQARRGRRPKESQ